MFSLMAYLSGTVGETGTIPTVTDNLRSEGKIEKESIGISYVPTTGTDLANGELTFGSEDSSKYATILVIPLPRMVKPPN